MLCQVSTTTGIVFGAGFILIVAVAIAIVIVTLWKRMQQKRMFSQTDEWLTRPQ